MCLGIPGRILDTAHPPGRPDLRTGMVDFGSVRRTVCLAYTPDAGPGDYVIVHVGFAITVVDAEEAARTLAVIKAMPGALATELGSTMDAP
ncbi:HypC/HybG/HupF family hydrogenase formation chaperone [Kibdelosporangium aridum]|uniref:HypC/HybG/HupF family hydrogenase formation chaperone n=1 Tax=Kibdelosporangium aridum TaxID=2030 RepID=A0A428ZAX2_KIBAR|nr:HypC/HybG/HupF family hydrogenase formation chaperone [Kibdelosporangium aridum]RSM85209.1 HypC/HybG/HupF family hydrogenase formation chaperone [Kibdelosporangium aridum]